MYYCFFKAGGGEGEAFDILEVDHVDQICAGCMNLLLFEVKIHWALQLVSQWTNMHLVLNKVHLCRRILAG